MFSHLFSLLSSQPRNLMSDTWDAMLNRFALGAAGYTAASRAEPRPLAPRMYAVAGGMVTPESRAPSAAENYGLPPIARFDRASGLAQIMVEGLIVQSQDGVDDWGDAYTSQASIQSALHTLSSLKPRVLAMHYNSPGGTALGNAETSALIRAFAEQIAPVHAYTDSIMASAAYFLASAADTVTAAPSAIVGSIQSVGTVTDSSGLYERIGIKVHALTNGAFKTTGYPGVPVTAAQLAERKKMVDYYSEEFTGHVATRRSGGIAAAIPAVSAALGSPVSAADLCTAMFQGQIWAAAAAPRPLLDGLHSTRRDHLQSLL